MVEFCELVAFARSSSPAAGALPRPKASWRRHSSSDKNCPAGESQALVHNTLLALPSPPSPFDAQDKINVTAPTLRRPGPYACMSTTIPLDITRRRKHEEETCSRRYRTRITRSKQKDACKNYSTSRGPDQASGLMAPSLNSLRFIVTNLFRHSHDSLVKPRPSTVVNLGLTAGRKKLSFSWRLGLLKVGNKSTTPPLSALSTPSTAVARKEFSRSQTLLRPIRTQQHYSTSCASKVVSN